MWPVLRGWLFRHVFTLLGWLAAASSVAAVLLGARQAGREFLALAADELDLMPESLAIDEMLSDYAIMREQARACRSSHS